MKGIRLLLAVSAVFCLTFNASAQLKNLFNKAVESTGVKPAQAVTAAIHTAPKPWILDYEYEGWNNDNPIRKYIKELGKQEKEAVLELDKQLRARIDEDRKIVAADGPGADEAQEEIDRYAGKCDPLTLTFYHRQWLPAWP